MILKNMDKVLPIVIFLALSTFSNCSESNDPTPQIDTIFVNDTILVYDSVEVIILDTLVIYDTLTVYDTLRNSPIEYSINDIEKPTMDFYYYYSREEFNQLVINVYDNDRKDIDQILSLIVNRNIIEVGEFTVHQDSTIIPLTGSLQISNGNGTVTAFSFLNQNTSFGTISIDSVNSNTFFGNLEMEIHHPLNDNIYFVDGNFRLPY